MSVGLPTARAVTVVIHADVHRAVAQLVIERGVRHTLTLLGANKSTLEEARVPYGRLTPRALESLRARLVQLGLVSENAP